MESTVPGIILSTKEKRKQVSDPIGPIGSYGPPLPPQPVYKSKAEMPVAGHYRRMDMPKFW